MMKSKGHLSLVPPRKTPEGSAEVPSKKSAAQEKSKTTISAESLVDGEIVIFAGGVRYSAKIWDNEKFTHELREAVRRGHNPAEAAKWFLELAVSKLNPYHTNLGPAETLRWEELFGETKRPA